MIIEKSPCSLQLRDTKNTVVILNYNLTTYIGQNRYIDYFAVQLLLNKLGEIRA